MEGYKIELAAVILIDLAVFIIGLFWLPFLGLWMTYHALGMLVICYMIHNSVECGTIHDSAKHGAINQ